MTVKFIDLFAGIGGFHHALSRFGSKRGRCVLTCEMDPYCRLVYEANFGRQKRFSNNIRLLTRSNINDENSDLSSKKIRKLVPKHSVLCGGFPCQPFSKSGKQDGVKDKTRGTLFFDIMQIVRARKPKYLMLENVRNLAGPKHVSTLSRIISSIRNAGYSVLSQPIILSPHLLPPKKRGGEGAPQVRDRVFILAIRSGRKERKKHQIRLQAIYDEVEAYRSIKKGWNPDEWTLDDVIKADADFKPAEITKFKVTKAERKWLDAWDAFVKRVPADNLPSFPIWVDVFKAKKPSTSGFPDWKIAFIEKNYKFYQEHKEVIDEWMEEYEVLSFPPSRRKFEWQARKTHRMHKGRTIRDLVIQMRPSGIRVKPPNYLPALVAITQTSIIGPAAAGHKVKEYRSITPQEAALLQGMPDDVFTKSGLEVPDTMAYKQLGNAVNVGVVRFLAARLIK